MDYLFYGWNPTRVLSHSQNAPTVLLLFSASRETDYLLYGTYLLNMHPAGSRLVFDQKQASQQDFDGFESAAHMESIEAAATSVPVLFGAVNGKALGTP